MLNTHQPNVVSKRVNQDKKNQIKGLEFTLFFNQENFNMVLISKEQILIDKDPFFKVKVFITKHLEHFHKNGLHTKTLKDTRYVFPLYP